MLLSQHRPSPLIYGCALVLNTPIPSSSPSRTRSFTLLPVSALYFSLAAPLLPIHSLPRITPSLSLSLGRPPSLCPFAPESQFPAFPALPVSYALFIYLSNHLPIKPPCNYPPAPPARPVFLSVAQVALPASPCTSRCSVPFPPPPPAATSPRHIEILSSPFLLTTFSAAVPSAFSAA
eukprot:2178841-Pleurochrysis_carterae.AAC.2